MTNESRIFKLRKDKNIKEPKERVFLCDLLQEVGEEREHDVYLSIEGILKIWGYEKFYDEMIDNLYRKVKNIPSEDVCVHYDTGEFNNDKTHQKLLGWAIYDDGKKKFGLVGGILFHNGEMSFHT